jgi:hypothetical protein
MKQREEFMPILLSQLSLSAPRRRQESCFCVAREDYKVWSDLLVNPEFDGIFSSNQRLDIDERA